VRPGRAAGQELLDELVAEVTAGMPGIERAPLFGSSGVRRDGALVAFIGRGGELVVRLPEGRAQQLLASGAAREVRMGRAAAREWVAVPRPADGAQPWRELLAAACAHAVG